MEPYYANKVFPCFDQPNMKAPFKLFIATNSTWKVISAGQLIKKYETKKDYESLSDIFKSVYEMKKIHEVYSLFEFEEISKTFLLIWPSTYYLCVPRLICMV